jgi:hypothetical protein
MRGCQLWRVLRNRIVNAANVPRFDCSAKEGGQHRFHDRHRDPSGVLRVTQLVQFQRNRAVFQDEQTSDPIEGEVVVEVVLKPLEVN